ncbi:hypothetical protein F5Y12DRAFT_710347 [Xylaria sp. FL1777]|nr:hypothetical protein F5Y12DRAFT_710347 [Xylaria sp. FL1777]
MYSTVTALITLAAVFTMGSAKCYGSGERGDWGKGLDDVNGLHTACSVLIGSYLMGESRQTCVQELNGTKWNFDLKNVGDDIRSIGEEQCLMGMSKEVHGCPRGGHRAADPNLGHCSDQIPPLEDESI